MALRPIGHRILVKPDEQPTESTGGLVLPEDRDHVPVSGTVVALGPGGSQIRYRSRQQAIRDCCEVIESTIHMFGPISALLIARDEMAGLLGSSDPERELQIGDRVAYPVVAGLRVTVDGQDYIVLNEDDVVVVVSDEVAA